MVVVLFIEVIRKGHLIPLTLALSQPGEGTFGAC
jgi:hypothetical protein